jgi:hypothetical protein
VLLVTVDKKHNGRLQSTQYIQKYVKCAVCGTEPTDTRADGHIPVTLVPHPPRIHCLHASVRLGRQQPSIFTSISSKGSCALRAVEDLCSDHAAGAATAMPRKFPCPLDGGEDGPLAMRAASQPRALCPFEASPPPPLCVASCEDAALARTASKGREEPARPVAAVGQQARRACPRAPEGRAKGRRAAADRVDPGAHPSRRSVQIAHCASPRF